jgi:hypothetical protein
VVWSGLLNISLLFIRTRHYRHSLLLHSILGWVIFAITYISILIILIPWGFNITVANSSLLLVIHGIVGLCVLGFGVMQVAGGVLIRLQLGKRDANLALLSRLKKSHAGFGYFLAVIYKINVIWSWYPTWIVMLLLLIWEAIIVGVLVWMKRERSQLREVVTDAQVLNN